MYKAKVYVTLRESILDPQGSAVKGGLHKLGFNEVKSVRIGKMIEITISDSVPKEEIDLHVQEMCERLLVNEVMEDYEIKIYNYEKENLI